MDTACLWIGRIVVGCGALAATAALCAIILNFVYVRFMDHAVFLLVLKNYYREKAAKEKWKETIDAEPGGLMAINPEWLDEMTAENQANGLYETGPNPLIRQEPPNADA